MGNGVANRQLSNCGMVPVWLNSGNTLDSINIVTLRRARLVPGWVTMLELGNNLGT